MKVEPRNHDKRMTTSSSSSFMEKTKTCLTDRVYMDFRTNTESGTKLRCLGALKVMGEEAEIDRLPLDLLALIFSLITSFTDLAQASGVCRKWRKAVERSMARRESLSFAGWRMDDDSSARLVHLAYNLKELDISRSRWGCHITDNGLYQIASAKCMGNLSSISLWGMTAITDTGVVQLISRASSLQHLNIGGTFISDESLFAIAECCHNLKSIGLWCCRHVTERGLLAMVDKCRKLESINVWGTRVPVDCFIGLLTISPHLQIKPSELLLNSQTPRPLLHAIW